MCLVDIDDIQLIEELWNKNRQYHIQIEPVFKRQYEEKTFDARMKEIIGDMEKQIKITLSKDGDEINGYCISGIKKGEGEIISIHVSSEKRNSGIGKELIHHHIRWMKDNGCTSIGVYVAAVNEGTIRFYERNGFKKNQIFMEISE